MLEVLSGMSILRSVSKATMKRQHIAKTRKKSAKGQGLIASILRCSALNQVRLKDD